MVRVILDIVLELFYWQKNTSICIEHALKIRLNIGQPKTFIFVITWHLVECLLSIKKIAFNFILKSVMLAFFFFFFKCFSKQLLLGSFSGIERKDTQYNHNSSL